MESKNPLERIRQAIVESKRYGFANEITRLGVSDELLKISDALDIYYGIVRKKKEEPSKNDGLIGVLDNVYKNPGHYKSIIGSYGNQFSRIGEERFSNVLSLLSRVKEPLAKMKETLSKDNPLYLNISTTIASIAVSNVVSSINNFQPTSRSRFDADLLSLRTGIDTGYYNLITSGTKVFRELEHFDMSSDFFDNFEANRKEIYSQNDIITDRVLNPKTSISQKSSSGSGCLFMALALSTSLLSCLGFIVLLLLYI